MNNLNQVSIENVKTERKEFKMHPSVLGHFIHSQAGSAGKAVIELIQNSIDAGAKSCVIDIDRDGFVLKDDGVGFVSKDEIETFFATFGTPHSDGDAKFGRFRVGRGQIMGFASTIWKSNLFKMSVDIQTIGYGFDLTESENTVHGCQITGTWYTKLRIIDEVEYSEDELEGLLAEIRGLVGYTDLNVTLNGKTISRNINSEPWDIETEDAYIRVKPTGPLIIYNQGILVREDSGHNWGCGGIVVTKKAIKLNISRTEILRKDCEIWQRILREVKKLSQKLRRDQNGRLDENGRILVAREMLAGNGNFDQRVITILPRTHISMNELRSKLHNIRVVVAPHGDIRIGEKVAISGLAIVLHPDMFYRFDCTDSIGLEESLKTALCRSAKNQSEFYFAQEFSSKFSITPFEEVEKLFFDESKIINIDEASKEVRQIFRAIQSPVRKLIDRAAEYQRNTFYPKIKIGRANNDLAWTDSTNYVAINETLLEDICANGRVGLQRLMSIMIHEACHAGDGDSREAAHDDMFYRRFHDSIIKLSPSIQYQVEKSIRNYLAICKRDKVKPRAWALR